MGAADSGDAHQLWMMCARDLLFYVNAFCWTFDPRVKPSILPFITYPYQDDALLAIDRAIGCHDLFIEKSRDMGASWMVLLVFEWRWHFHEMQSFLLVSRKEDLVDKTEDPKSLMWKLDFLHKRQPGWLLPGMSRQKLHLHNEDNGSTIDGESTTGDVARGDRRSAIVLDEFAAVDDGHRVLAATADATTCRIFNSTPQGSSNAFYDLKQKPGLIKLRFHWTQHPIKAKGLYDVDGKPRSPWYDEECKRRAHPQEIAQELDIDYLGSDYQFFDAAILDRLMRDTVRRPFGVGELDFDIDTCEPERFRETEGGRLLLWLHPDAKGEVPRDRKYVAGIDVATGTGASNSVVVVADQQTGEKVAEFVSNRLAPHELAPVAVALAKWFAGSDDGGAFMVWEANGPGRVFGNTVMDRHYTNVYFRRDERRVSRAMTDVPGWWSTKENKLALIGDYRRALEGGDFIDRSHHCLDECRQYVYLQSNQVAHARSASKIDPSGARENHGDRVTASALCWLGMKRETTRSPQAPEVPVGCMQWRRDQARRKREAETSW